MLVEVNETDIKNGKRNSTCYCAIALAIKRVVKDSIDVLVNKCKVRITSNISSEVLKIELPFRVRLFIDEFDNEIKVEPFEFEINIPNEYCSYPSDTP